MTPQPQPESVPSDELDRWLEGEIREARYQANEAVRLLHTDQKWYQRGRLQALLQVHRYRKGETAELTGTGVSQAPRTIRELDDR
jgi:hypothetical protein